MIKLGKHVEIVTLPRVDYSINKISGHVPGMYIQGVIGISSETLNVYRDLLRDYKGIYDLTNQQLYPMIKTSSLLNSPIKTQPPKMYPKKADTLFLRDACCWVWKYGCMSGFEDYYHKSYTHEDILELNTNDIVIVFEHPKEISISNPFFEGQKSNLRKTTAQFKERHNLENFIIEGHASNVNKKFQSFVDATVNNDNQKQIPYCAINKKYFK